MKDLAAKAKGKETVARWVDPEQHPCRACRPDARVNIRTLIMADYEQVWKLWQLCKIPVGGSYSRTALERMVSHDQDLSLIAEMNGIIIGAVLGLLHGGQGQISNHAVDPRCRGRGIGTMLFKEIEGKLVAKGASEIEVMVPIDSLNGRKFFEDVGFVDDGRYAFLVKQYQEGRRKPGV